MAGDTSEEPDAAERKCVVMDRILKKLLSLEVELSASQISRVSALSVEDLESVYGKIEGCELQKTTMMVVIEAVNRHEKKHRDTSSAATRSEQGMREFFKGWRRRAGVVTLVMAMVFIGIWVRTEIFTDQLEMMVGDSKHFFTSTEGCFRWTCHRKQPMGASSPLWYSVDHGSPGQPLDNEGAIQWHWRWKWCLFDVGSGQYRGSQLSTWACPYWIGIPLAGLSAALLILSPRKPSHATTACSRPT